MILAPAIAACSLLERLESQPVPTAGTGPGSGSGVASPLSSEPGVSGPGASGPIASEPVPVPDPLNPVTHQPGEEVKVPGGTIVYLGLLDATGGVVARFRVTNGTLETEPRLLAPGGRVLDLDQSGGLLESEPFDAPSGRDTTLTLIVGEVLVVFEAGSLP